MKDITTYITESKADDYALFVGLVSARNKEGFSFKEGEKVLLMRFTTHHYQAQIREIYTVTKVNKKSVKTDWDKDHTLKLNFNEKGICVHKEKNRYTGNSTDYWVLFNKELIEDEKQNPLKQLIEKGSCSEGFSFTYHEKEDVAELKKKMKEVTG